MSRAWSTIFSPTAGSCRPTPTSITYSRPRRARWLDASVPNQVMVAVSLLWIPFTLLAAAGQTARNAMQRELTATLGTVGATHVRFLFGFPFAMVFLAAVLFFTGLPLPVPPGVFLPWALLGAGARSVSPS